MQRKASAVWKGDLTQGQGTVSTASGVLAEKPYSFHTRFEDGAGTNPEELLGASHAGCFSMALSMILGQAELQADSIETEATVSLEEVADGFAVTAVHLVVKARVPGATAEKFAECADAAKAGCPISKVLDTQITMDARLV